MNAASALLNKLLNYVIEQSKLPDPHGFDLATQKGLVLGQATFAGLPGVELDIKVDGDHIWLSVARLEATNSPLPS